MMIHSVLHDQTKRGVSFNSKPIYIKTGNNDCRYISYDGKTFMEQNHTKSSKYAAMAVKGDKITWVMRPNKLPWGLIINNTIERE